METTTGSEATRRVVGQPAPLSFVEVRCRSLLMWTGAWFRERGYRARRIGCQFCLRSVDFCRELLIGRIELERSLPIDLSLAQIVQCLVGVANMFENDRVFRF